MSEPQNLSPSLLGSSESATPFLFSEKEMEALEVVELREGKYTGERLLARRPHVYQLVVKLLGQKWSINSICEVCGVHAYTVAAVCEREKISIEDHKRVAITNLAVGSRMLIERLMELAPTADDIKSVAVALGIAVEKLQLLSGGATSRVEGLDAPQNNPFADWLASAKPADARVIDVTPKMGSDGCEGGQIGAGLEGGLEGVPPAGTDNKSDVSGGSNRVTTEIPTAFDTKPSDSRGGQDQGGRGSGI